MSFDLKALGNRIREERMIRNLTIEELAELINLSPSHIGLVERGDRGLGLDKLCLLSEIFHVTTDSLLKGKVSLEEGGQGKLKEVETLLYFLNDKEYEFIIDVIKSYFSNLRQVD